MIKRIWFPGLCALIIVALVYWFWPGRVDAPEAGTDAVPAVAPIGKDQSVQKPITTNNQTEMQNITTATLNTNMGKITIVFNPATPKTVENFIKLAQSGFYDGTKFHRVIKGFMNQGGDPLSKDDAQTVRWGTGGPGYQFADEISAENHNEVGTIAMANSGPNTNGSQFFINASANNFLDAKHTVFGRVVEGLEVSNAINAVTTESSDRPVKPVVIESITLK